MSKNLSFIDTPFKYLFIINRHHFSDDRCIFYRLYCEEELKNIGLNKTIKQLNYSFSSKKYTTRGFHYQKSPYQEIKIVTCLSGAIFDVVIDIRLDSPTYLKWYGIELSSENKLSILIPEGFAHGTQALTDQTALLYMHTNNYNINSEDGLNVNDPLLDVVWPNAPKYLSKRDNSFEYLENRLYGAKNDNEV